MNKAREMKYKKEHENDFKPGSGNVWQNKLTVPREPRLRVSESLRSRSVNKQAYSLSKIISINDLHFNDESMNHPYSNANSFLNQKHRLIGRRKGMKILHESLNESHQQEIELEARPLEQTKNLTMTTSSLNERDKEILLQGEILK